MVFACVASTLWILTSIYSIGYMRGHGEQNQTGYFAAFAMCLCAATGLCFAGNLITFFIFFEVLTVATYPLVVHYRDAEGTVSGRKYLAYTLISGQIFFAAIVIVYSVSGTMDFVPGGFITKDMLPMPWALVVFFMMIGAGYAAQSILKEMSLFFGGRIFSGAVDTGLMYLFIDVLMISDLISKIVVQVIVIILNYIFSKLIVFKD